MITKHRQHPAGKPLRTTKERGSALFAGIAALAALLLSLPPELHAQMSGCTDPAARNYNPAATRNDGSCVYDSASVAPISSSILADTLSETSALAAWEGLLLTVNDDTDRSLYAIDPNGGRIVRRTRLEGVANRDWEAVTQDSGSVYIGDFGNNENGNRRDLRILRIDKNSLRSGAPVIDTIEFAYADQTNFTATGSNNTDFDCEAFIASSDSLYLFTKQWISHRTAVYALPKAPGRYAAMRRAEWDAQGLVTDATFLERGRLVLLCGYSTLLQPFLFLFYDFEGARFFGGNRRKVEVQLPFHQVEGIATADGLTAYITNEYLSVPPLIRNPQKLHALDLAPLLGPYLRRLGIDGGGELPQQHADIYPQPASTVVYLAGSADSKPARYAVYDVLGRVVLRGMLAAGVNAIRVAALPRGTYTMRIEDAGVRALRFSKL
jgi:hypothetical protein